MKETATLVAALVLGPMVGAFKGPFTKHLLIALFALVVVLLVYGLLHYVETKKEAHQHSNADERRTK